MKLHSLCVCAVVVMSGSCATVAHAQCEAVFFNPWLADPIATDLVGNASYQDQYVRLTPQEEGQTGAMWATQRGSLRNGFDTIFSFRLSGEGNFGAGDGFAFVIQNNGTAQIGGGGSDLGYSGIPGGIAIEFDTFYFSGEIEADHISIQQVNDDGFARSEDADSLASAVLPFDLNDGELHWAYISYRDNVMKVIVDGVTTISTLLDLDDVNGYGILSDEGCAYVGFTAGTGGAFSEHAIESWSFGDTATCGQIGLYDFIPGDPIRVGSRVTFRAAPTGSGPWRFDWKLNGQDLVNGGSISGVGTPFLTIDPVGPEHQGQFDYGWGNRCNGLGTGFYLNVQTSCSCDFNLDGFVDDTDFVSFAACYENFVAEGECRDADVFRDDFIDDADFVIFASQYEEFACP